MSNEPYEPCEPMTDDELRPLRRWCEDIGTGSDGFYLEVKPVVRMLEEIDDEIDHVRAENGRLRPTIDGLRSALHLALSNVEQPSLFAEPRGDDEAAEQPVTQTLSRVAPRWVSPSHGALADSQVDLNTPG